MDSLNKEEKSNPVVSVIIPVFNVVSYLEKSVKSVCTQTYDNLEILLIDDGSTDGSDKLCDSLANHDARIRVIHKKNSGIADTRNVGLENVHGNFIVFIDSDDWVKSDMIERLLNVLLNENADIVACENYFVYGDRIEKPDTSGKCVRQDSDSSLKTLLDDRKFRSRTWGRIYKASTWKGISFPSGTTYEDVSTVYKTYLKAKVIVLLDEPLYFYNQRDNSIVHSDSYKSFFNLLDARILRKKELGKLKPKFLPELKVSVIAAIIDIYREAALSNQRLDFGEDEKLQLILSKNYGKLEKKLLSPRYRAELNLLKLSKGMFYSMENKLNSLVIHIKRMGK